MLAGNVEVATQVPGLAGVRMIAAGCAHGTALDVGGLVWTWGNAWSGDLGHAASDNEVILTPWSLGLGAFAGSVVVLVVVGHMHSAAVTEQGDLWVWRSGNRGALGLGDVVQRLVPTLVGAGQASPWAGSRVRTASCGFDHTLVLTEDGAVWSCGNGYHGANGHAEEEHNVLVPTRIAQERFGGAPCVHVTAGFEVSMAVTAEGILYAWGTGALGGRGGVLPVPKPVATSLAPGSRVGRGCGVLRRHTTAFCMGVHARLGGGDAEDGGAGACVFQWVPENVLEMIVEQTEVLMGVYELMGEGQLRLLAVRERVC